MASRNRSRYVMKENQIPLGKKREVLEKTGGPKKTQEFESGTNQINPKKKSSEPNKKTSIINQAKHLKVINFNVAPTDTSLTKVVEKPRAKLSTIKEIKEMEDKALKSGNNPKTKPRRSVLTVSNDTASLIIKKNSLKEDSTKLVEYIPKENDLDNFNNTIDELNIKPPVPEVVLSPFVCTTRGQKWRPSPRKPPKLSELFNKYDDDNVADTYRKKLDDKTIELQTKVNYWSEFASENSSAIPQAIKDDIDVACGQTKLLTTDKFMQMRSLIEEYDNKSGSMPIKTDDLDGFWDMLLLQVEKLEGQFNQLVILKENNWAPIQPIARRVINKVLKTNKRPEVKSKIADFLKNQREKKILPNTKNSNTKNYSKNSKFNEMKLPNDICLISSTPTRPNQKNVSFTPMLLKTMELSYVARRSGMTPHVLAEPHVSPLKPALKNPDQEKGTKRKNIHFEHPKISDGLVTPENSCNENANHKKSIQDRIPTPHTLKSSKVNRNNVVIPQNNPTNLIKANHTENKTKEKSTEEENIECTQNNCTVRRSSRLAKKPSKNYKC